MELHRYHTHAIANIAIGRALVGVDAHPLSNYYELLIGNKFCDGQAYVAAVA